MSIGFLMVFAVSGCCNVFIDGVVPSESGFEGAATVLSEDEKGPYGIVCVEVPYLDAHGNPAKGQARLVVHRRHIESGESLPAFCHVHYEKSADGAYKWARDGWAVFTAAYTGMDGEYPIDVSIGNGNNLARAIIQWARRLPFIDRARLHIDGGSQGGYMALAMSADMFPVTATTADVPVVNWAYNLNYFEANRGPIGHPTTPDKSPLPVLCSVLMLADWAYQYLPSDLSDEAWYYVSPISYLDRIANPVLVTSVTGDMLVPIEQMTRGDLVQPFDTARLPEDYQRDFDTLTVCEEARKTFEECVGGERRETFVAPLQEDSFELTYAMMTGKEKKPRKRPKNMDKPWSKDRQWSILYCDEGPVGPEAGHTTFEWAMSPDGFVEHYREAEPSPDILNAPKLERLMQRYAGDLANLPRLGTGKPINRLNFEAVEQWDVLQGLLDYAGISELHEVRLIELYASCSLKPLGEGLSMEILRAELDQRAPQEAVSVP